MEYFYRIICGKVQIHRLFCSLVLAFLLCLSKILLPYVTVMDSFDDFKSGYLTFFSIKWFVLYTVLFLILINLIYTLIERTQIANNTAVLHIFLRCFIASYTVFFVAFIAFYPGCAMNDTINAMMSPWTLFQPPIYQMYIYFFMKGATTLTGDAITAFSIFILIQMVAFSLVVSYVYIWMIKRVTSKLSIVVFWILILLSSGYAVTMVKDTPFAISFLMYIPCLVDIIEKKASGVTTALFVVSSMGLWITRSNGKFIVLIGIVLIPLFTKERKDIIRILVFVLLMVMMSKIVTYHNEVIHGLPDTGFRDSISVPLNQIGAVIATEGSISENDISFLNKVLPLDEWKTGFNRSLIDPIKLSYNLDVDFLNSNKSEFFSTYLRILKENPSIVINTYLNFSYGWWSLSYYSPVDKTQSIFTRILNNVSEETDWGLYINSIGLKNTSLFPEQIGIVFESVYSQVMEIAERLFRIIVIIFLILSVEWVIENKKKSVITVIAALLPMYVYVATNLLASPSSIIFRYQYPVSLLIPVYLTLMKKE